MNKNILIFIKKIIVVMIFSMLIIAAMAIFKPAEAIDQDKSLHASGSAGISYVASKHYDDIYSPFFLATAIGFAKEATDARFDKNDMSANMIGALFGTMAGNQKKILPSWSTTDKILIQSYAWMNVIDILQTRECLALPNCSEINPALGLHPANTSLFAAKIAGTGAIYWLADTFEESRTPMLFVANIIQFVVVRHNYFELKF